LTENVAVLSYTGSESGREAGTSGGTVERYRLLEFLAYIGSEVHKNFVRCSIPRVART
jgi:hypothetical protein